MTRNNSLQWALDQVLILLMGMVDLVVRGTRESDLESDRSLLESSFLERSFLESSFLRWKCLKSVEMESGSSD